MNAVESEARRSALISLVSQTAPAHSRYNRKVLMLRLGLPFSGARNFARQMCCLNREGSPRARQDERRIKVGMENGIRHCGALHRPKDTACVDACPVDCIHPKKDEVDYEAVTQLYIDPIECIDCGACVPVCPVSAIFSLDDLPEKWAHFTEMNAQYFKP